MCFRVLPIDKHFNPFLGEDTYSVLQMLLNIPIFYLDYLTTDENGYKYWENYIFTSIIDVRRCFEQLKIGTEHVLHLLVKKQLKGSMKYDVQEIKEVIEAKDEHNQPTWIFLLKNGKKFINGGVTKKESELYDKRHIYFNKLFIEDFCEETIN